MCLENNDNVDFQRISLTFYNPGQTEVSTNWKRFQAFAIPFKKCCQNSFLIKFLDFDLVITRSNSR